MRRSPGEERVKAVADAGYPSLLVYLVVALGLPLAVIWPMYAFAGVTFVLSAADAHLLTMTRTTALGPYFNGNDALLLIALVATVVNGQLKVPRIVWLMLGVLLIAFTQSAVAFGMSYETIRAMRWAISLPVCYSIAASIVDRPERLRIMLFALFLGSMLGSLQHLFVMQNRLGGGAAVTAQEFSMARTIVFRNAGQFLLLAFIIWRPKIRGLGRPLWIFGCILFGASVILSQTRSFWISSIVSLPAIAMVFRERESWKKGLVVPAIAALFLLLVFGVIELLIPSLDAVDVVGWRLESLTDEEKRQMSTITRQLSIERELGAWLEGTLVFGRGLFFFAREYHEEFAGMYRIAWGHVGHVTTLSQTGLIGLLVYSLLLPLGVIKSAKQLWRQSSHEARLMALTAGGCAIWYWFCFFMSDNFLATHMVEGFLFGAVWRQALYYQRLQTRAGPDGYGADRPSAVVAETS